MDEREAAEREEIGGGETNGDWLGFHPGHWFCFAAGMGKRSETPTRGKWAHHAGTVVAFIIGTL